jgi:hypothetical protein
MQFGSQRNFFFRFQIIIKIITHCVASYNQSFMIRIRHQAYVAGKPKNPVTAMISKLTGTIDSPANPSKCTALVFPTDKIVRNLPETKLPKTMARKIKPSGADFFGCHTYPLGKETVNVVPASTLLSTSIVPLCIATIFLTIERPNPLPPPAFVRDLSAL